MSSSAPIKPEDSRENQPEILSAGPDRSDETPIEAIRDDARTDYHVVNAIQFLNDSRPNNNKRFSVERVNNANIFYTILKNLGGKIEVERDQYTIEVLENPEHKDVPRVHELLGKVFDPAELDPLDIMQDQMRGLRYGYPSIGTKAVYFAIKNEKGEVVTTLGGALLPLKNQSGQETGESVFMVFYIATLPELRQFGLGREALITAYQYAQREAKRRNLRCTGAAGECTYTSRIYWERMGWKRVYGEEPNGSFREIPYMQPPLAFDLESGEPAEGADDAPEHFMVHFFDPQKANDPELSNWLASIVRAMYKTNNYIAREAFDTSVSTSQSAQTAYNTHVRRIEGHENKFANDVTGKSLSFLSKDECDALRRKDIEVEDYLTPKEKENGLPPDVPSSGNF